MDDVVDFAANRTPYAVDLRLALRLGSFLRAQVVPISPEFLIYGA